jgi:hypothetical protein
VLVDGRFRARLLHFLPNDRYFQVSVEEYPIEGFGGAHTEALVRNVIASFENYAKLSKKIPSEVLMQVTSLNDPAKLADTVVAHLPVKLTDKQEILELPTPKDQMEKLLPLLEGEIEILEIEKKIRGRVKKQMERTQKEFYLNEQMRAIQKELGQGDEGRTELDELEEKVKKKKMNKEAQGGGDRQPELHRLAHLHPLAGAHRGQARHRGGREGAERGSLWPGEGQGADSRVPRGPKAGNETERADPLLRGSPGSGKDLPGQVDRAGDGTKVRPHVPGWRSRRGGDQGAPEDLYRGAPGEDHAADEEGGFGQPRVSA